MIDFFSQYPEIGGWLIGTYVVLFLYHLIIVGPLKKRIIYLEEETQEVLDEVYALSQKS
jgi:hypothetical protein